MRIIRELRSLIILEFFFGFSLQTVNLKSNRLITPRHSYFVQFLLILLHIYYFYVCISVGKFIQYSHAEELLNLCARSCLFSNAKLTIFSAIPFDSALEFEVIYFYLSEYFF